MSSNSDLAVFGFSWYITILTAVSLAAIYLFRLYTIWHCMSQRLEFFVAPIDRAIWVALAFFVPLGLGAFLFHLQHKNFKIVLLFLVPFGFVGSVCVLLWLAALNGEPTPKQPILSQLCMSAWKY